MSEFVQKTVHVVSNRLVVTGYRLERKVVSGVYEIFFATDLEGVSSHRRLL